MISVMVFKFMTSAPPVERQYQRRDMPCIVVRQIARPSGLRCDCSPARRGPCRWSPPRRYRRSAARRPRYGERTSVRKRRWPRPDRSSLRYRQWQLRLRVKKSAHLPFSSEPMWVRPSKAAPPIVAISKACRAVIHSFARQRVGGGKHRLGTLGREKPYFQPREQQPRALPPADLSHHCLPSRRHRGRS